MFYSMNMFFIIMQFLYKINVKLRSCLNFMQNITISANYAYLLCSFLSVFPFFAVT